MPCRTPVFARGANCPDCASRIDFEAWLWQIAVNACRSALRTRRRVNVREVAVDQMPAGFDLPSRARAFDEGVSEADLVRAGVPSSRP